MQHLGCLPACQVQQPLHLLGDEREVRGSVVAFSSLQYVQDVAERRRKSIRNTSNSNSVRSTSVTAAPTACQAPPAMTVVTGYGPVPAQLYPIATQLQS
mgnify:CR=1 FL=1